MATDGEIELVVTRFLLSVAKDDKRMFALLRMSVGRIMIRDWKKGFEPAGQDIERPVRHVADWIAAAVANDAAWLRNVDGHGRPRKLAKFGSIAAMAAESDRQMARNATSRKKPRGTEELFEGDPSGLHVVRLLTPLALDIEGKAMRHCIGDGAYDANLTARDHLFLSVRDGDDRPLATLEIVEGDVVQFQGPRNAKPDDALDSAVRELLKAREFDWDSGQTDTMLDLLNMLIDGLIEDGDSSEELVAERVDRATASRVP